MLGALGWWHLRWLITPSCFQLLDLAPLTSRSIQHGPMPFFRVVAQPVLVLEIRKYTTVWPLDALRGNNNVKVKVFQPSFCSIPKISFI